MFIENPPKTQKHFEIAEKFKDRKYNGNIKFKKKEVYMYIILMI